MFQFLAEIPFVTDHPGVLIYNVLQMVNIVAGFDGERKAATPYSKFAPKPVDGENDAMVPSKLGMLIIYMPAMITAMGFLFVLPKFIGSAKPNLAVWMLLTHFAKRNLEVLFLHKYSGFANLSMAKFIGFYYALSALMTCIVAEPETPGICFYLSIVLFATGFVFNFYHHYLLASLRSKQSERKYLPPTGGLFEYVAAPHYFFELISWLGIAVASQQLTGYLTFLSMASYLLARSCNQNDWNKRKFDENEWPRSKKNLIPFIY